MKIVPYLAACLCLTIAFQAGDAAADAGRALLIEGKHALYQRIITKPGARLTTACGAPDTEAEELPAFSIYYVYSRQGDCVEVGANVSGPAKGFLKTDTVTDWKQSIVVAFNNREEAGRNRQMFFDSKDQLSAASQDPEAGGLNAMRQAIASGSAPEGSGLVAIEPEKSIDIESNFYLLPILEFEQTFLADGQEGNYIRVASIAAAKETAPPPDAPARNAPYRAGIVFILDTTRSMQPYIDQTLAALRQIQSVLAGSEQGANIRFGLTAFRQSTHGNARIDYHVKTFLPLGETAGAGAFLQALSQVRAAEAPTQGFDEDSLGGVYEAINNMDWSPYTAKFAVLVTDAGPRNSQDPNLYVPDLGPDQLAGLAERKNVYLLAVHLLTASGKSDHDYAADQYRRLTTLAGRDHYLPVANGTLADYGVQVDAIGRQLAANVKAMATGREIEPVNETAGAEMMSRMGRALQLDYLGRRDSVSAPQFFEAWTTDRSLDTPTANALDSYIMVTKNQLSTLSGVLEQIVQEGEAPGSQVDPLAFFKHIQELAARANNDTRQIAADTELGTLLGEYLEDLPYKSYILNLTADDWVRLNRQKQREILAILKSKLVYYQGIHNTPAKWVKLDPDAMDGEMVSLLPLHQVP